MSLDMAGVLDKIRALIATVSGINEVYVASDEDNYAIPDTLENFPAIIIYPGPDTGDGYVLSNGYEDHEYVVSVQVFETGESRVSNVLPVVQQIIALFSGNVSLGGRVDYCLYDSQSGMSTLTYGGLEYAGYDITLHVRESGPVTPAVGSY